jgi:hypothetical protein
MKEDVARYQEIGCVSCLSKPVDKTLFYQTLAQYLGTSTKYHEQTDTGDHRDV